MNLAFSLEDSVAAGSEEARRHTCLLADSARVAPARAVHEHALEQGIVVDAQGRLAKPWQLECKHVPAKGKPRGTSRGSCCRT